ncbi:glycoside hydrolase superfamily [Hysterangium stoloniferum]|nr:glycoside hydrolase superfamily [Hysterangium stoloniferum]
MTTPRIGYPNWQKNLSFYCADASVDVLPMAFLNTFFDKCGLPSIDFSNICSKGTNAWGALVWGANFTSASQATNFADLIWNLFLGGTSNTRPFGSSVLDGIHPDIETGSTLYFDSVIRQIQSHAANANKMHWNVPITDITFLLRRSADFRIRIWEQYWIRRNSIWFTFNSVPLLQTATLPSSYVNTNAIITIIQQTKTTYSSFRGVILWDASLAYNNGRLDSVVKACLTDGNTNTPPQPTSSVFYQYPDYLYTLPDTDFGF